MQKKLNQYIWTLRQIETLKEKLNNETDNYVSDDVISNNVDGDEANQPTTLEGLKAKLKTEYGNIDEQVFVLTDKVCYLIIC